MAEQDQQIHELAKEVAVLRADMNTKQAETETSIERLRADMANWKADMANWKADMAKRENRLLLAMLGGIAVATAILGVLISGIPAA